LLPLVVTVTAALLIAPLISCAMPDTHGCCLLPPTLNSTDGVNELCLQVAGDNIPCLMCSG